MNDHRRAATIRVGHLMDCSLQSVEGVELMMSKRRLHLLPEHESWIPDVRSHHQLAWNPQPALGCPMNAHQSIRPEGQSRYPVLEYLNREIELETNY